MSNFDQQLQKIKTADGFIAALDQSGGSTPKALRLYGIEESAYSNDSEMFAMVHEMRSRIITSPSFGNGKVIGAILFGQTTTLIWSSVIAISSLIALGWSTHQSSST